MEPREDELPNEEGTKSVVKKDVKPVKKDVKKEAKPKSISPPPDSEDAPVEEVKPPKGSQTPEGKQHAAFLEEREKRKEAERRLEDLEASSAPYEEEPSNPDVEARLKKLEEEKELKGVLTKNPVLDEKRDEFDKYRGDNPNLSAEQASVLFLNEQGVSEEKPAGLEKPTSGPKELPTSGYTPEQVEEIRVKEPRRYERMVEEGKFDKVDWGSFEG